MHYRSLASIDARFWCTAKPEKPENPDFGHLKHLQNPVTLSLTSPCLHTVRICQHMRKIICYGS